MNGGTSSILMRDMLNQIFPAFSLMAMLKALCIRGVSLRLGPSVDRYRGNLQASKWFVLSIASGLADVQQTSFMLWPRPSADRFIRAATCSDPSRAGISVEDSALR